MEVVPNTNYELAKQAVFNENEIKTSEIIALTAIAVATSVILVPMALSKGYGPRLMNKINESPKINKTMEFIVNEVEMLAHVFTSGYRGTPRIG